MNRSRRTEEILRSLCGQPDADDGVDLRLQRPSSPSRSQRFDRKTAQLCAQVGQTLDLVFSESRQELLQAASVLRVDAAANSSQMLVTVVLRGSADPVQLDALQAELARQAGRLRAEVAASITRKKAPSLQFRVVPEFLQPEIDHE